MKVINNNQKSISNGLAGRMFVSICAIFASQVICVGSFIESLVELFKALRNVYNASMKALEQEQQK
jgi:hypothetical protein